MDPIQNPFSPGAGSPPPELVGRESLLNQGNILYARVKQKLAEKSIILTGLRGVGKTVLLNELERFAEKANYKTILFEAHEDKSLAEMLIPPLRQLLYQLDKLAGAGHKVRRGLAVLRSFINTIKFKAKAGDIEIRLDIEPEIGVADSGDLEADLTNLFIAVAEAAEEKNTAIAILIDEIQYFSSKELSALIIALHRMQQRLLPIVLVAAGLPILPGLAGEAKTYAERLFQFPQIGALSADDVEQALQEPVKRHFGAFEPEAINEIYRLTEGYPYFVQEWGYQVWNHAKQSPITLKDINDATPDVISRLDNNFFRVRFDRLSPSERRFLRAMAEVNKRSISTSKIAEILGLKIQQTGPVRSKLIKKGMIYSPEYGTVAFTVPLFGDFMRRIMPTLGQ
ncbi:MAG: AAA family ATPase [Legionellales bacterium]|nr:AAA family ATPase [Legionellales bacterium]|tara:strand:+ start:36857 stop:38047 length:1191 start_codon:yes stop_codon:yes gene_type:complete